MRYAYSRASAFDFVHSAISFLRPNSFQLTLKSLISQLYQDTLCAFCIFCQKLFDFSCSTIIIKLEYQESNVESYERNQSARVDY